jgi:putative peptidoglycan lipid II flippase
MASRLTGLVREMVMAGLFGAGMVYDTFLLGFRIPNLTRDLFAEGALSSAFIPTFTEYLTKRSKEEAVRLANLVTTAIIIFVGAFCALGVLFSPQIVDLLAPGFRGVPGKHELAVTMTRIMFPFLLLISLAAQAMGILNTCNKFAIPALASTFFNIGSVGVGLTLGYWAGPKIGLNDPIMGMAIGVVVGGALQLLWQVPSLRREGFAFRPRINWSDPGLRKIIRMMGPAILGAAAVQINVMVNTNFASRIVDPVTGPDGPVSWLGYAFRFMQLPLGVFGVAIASATLPSISRSAASGNLDEFRRTLSRSLGMVFLLTVPSSVGLVILGEPMIAAIFERGRFAAYDTHQTALALSYFAIGLVGYSAIKVLAPAFYAAGDAKTPMFVSLASIATNLLAVILLLRYTDLSHAGLALSTSIVAVSGSLVLFWILRSRIGGVYGRDLFASTSRIILAATVMGVLVFYLSDFLQTTLGGTGVENLTELAICIPVGVGIFYFLCRLTRVPELELATNAIAGPLAQKLASRRAKIS